MEPILTSIGAAMVAWVPLAAAGFYGYGRLSQKVENLVVEVKRINGQLDARMKAAEGDIHETQTGLAEMRGRQDRR